MRWPRPIRAPSRTLPDPDIPVIQVSGTNGKTTTTRLIAHMVMTAGKRVAFSSTDGVYRNDRLVKKGDYSGFGGAAIALAQHPDVAVLETARGGILLRGIGVAHNDVAVVTNVSADHLHLQGISTVDQLAEVKATVTRITRQGRMGGPERRRSARPGDATGGQRSALVVLDGSPPPGVPRGARRRRPRDQRAGRDDRLDGGLHRAPVDRPRPGARDARRPVADLHAERARRGRRRIGRGAPGAERDEGPSHLRPRSAEEPRADQPVLTRPSAPGARLRAQRGGDGRARGDPPGAPAAGSRDLARDRHRRRPDRRHPAGVRRSRGVGRGSPRDRGAQEVPARAATGGRDRAAPPGGGTRRPARRAGLPGRAAGAPGDAEGVRARRRRGDHGSGPARPGLPLAARDRAPSSWDPPTSAVSCVPGRRMRVRSG